MLCGRENSGFCITNHEATIFPEISSYTSRKTGYLTGDTVHEAFFTEISKVTPVADVTGISAVASSTIFVTTSRYSSVILRSMFSEGKVLSEPSGNRRVRTPCTPKFALVLPALRRNFAFPSMTGETFGAVESISEKRSCGINPEGEFAETIFSSTEEEAGRSKI